MADISKIVLPDNSEYNFKDATSGYITNPNIPYCTCATAAGTKAKTTTIVSGTFTADDLVTGAQVLVKFTNSNSIADPTLKIGSTTAKTIKRYGTTAPSTSAASSWNAGAVMMFTYDGTYWQMVDWVNTTYTSMTVAEYEAGTGTTARSITPARLKGAIEYWASGGQGTITEVKTTAGTHTAIDVTSGSASFNVPTNTSHLTNDSGFVTSSSLATVATSGDYTDLTNKPVFSGSTTTKTPTEVKDALDNGYTVNITHVDNTYGVITANNFNTSAMAGVIVANVVFYYTGVGLLCFELIGNLNTDAWANNIYTLAQSSDIPTVPTNISAFTNDSGYLTSYTETDPTVPSWAKASSKPSYTASEVGALSNTGGEVSGNVTLKVSSGNSPALIFQRGTLTDNYNDWQIQDRAGFLYFDQRGQGSSAFTNQVYFNTSGGVYATTFNGSGANLTGVVHTETDPVFTASAAHNITSGNITDWNNAITTANTALSGVNGNLIYDHTFSISNGVATFTPHVYQKGAEVTTDYAASCFTWKYRLINGSEVALTTKGDRGCDVTISVMGYGGHVIGTFTPT